MQFTNTLFDPHFIFIVIHTGEFLERNRVSDCIMNLSYALNCTVNAVTSLRPTVSSTELPSAGAANVVSRNGKTGKYSHCLPLDIAAVMSLQLQKYEGY